LLVLAVILIVVFLLLLPPTQDLLRKYLVDPFSPHYPEEVQMEIDRTMVLDANGGLVTEFAIDVPRPVSIFEDGVYLQRVTQIGTSPEYDDYLEGGTYDTMLWNGEDLYGTFTLNITISVTQTLHRWELDENEVLGREEVPQVLLDRYLDDEWKIIVDNPVIERLSEDIVGEENNVYLIARAIYDWIDENVDYHIWTGSSDPLSSLETNNERRGDCDDQSILFCALARAAGVPAWLQLGAVYDRSSGEMGGHGWVQMYMPTEAGGTNVTIDIVNDNFLVWMPNLFCEYTDNGEPGDLYDAYHSIAVYYDPFTYGPGETPTVDEGWDVLSYEESEETVTLRALMIKDEF